MNLCADKADGTSYFIDAEYTEGCLKISGQDLGKLPEEIFGRDEYEYFYSLDEFNTNKLISALGVLQQDFMSEIQKRFSGLEGLIKWREFCDNNGIEYTFFNWY